jgi:hypothetical protein
MRYPDSMIRLLAVGLALAALQAPPPSPVGLLGHWTGDAKQGDDVAPDASGAGRAGKYSAGAGVSGEKAPLKFPNAGSFGLDGKTGMITVPDDPALRRSGDFTLSFWKRKTENNADWVRIVGKGNGAARNFGLWEYPGDGGALKYQQYTAGGQSILELDSPPMPSLNTWRHVVCTASVNACALYVDGKPVGFARRSGEPGIAPDPLTFGHAGYHGFFAGQIDDVRLYDRALSMSEIDYLASGKGPPEPPSDLAFKDGVLSWKASATPPPAGTLTTYAVRKAGRVVVSGLPGTSWNDPDPKTGAASSFVVTALNTGGESAPSAELKPAVPAK